MKAFKAGALFALGFVTVRAVAVVTGAIAIAVLEKTAEKPAETTTEPQPLANMDTLMEEAESFLNGLLMPVRSPTDEQIYDMLVSLRDGDPKSFRELRDGECLDGPNCRVHVVARQMID